MFLGSSNAAGAEDFTAVPPTTGLLPKPVTTAVDCRRYTWGIDMSGADFVEIAGGESPTGTRYTIVAIAVNSAGVAISATTTEDVEK